jgi:type II secretory ATPase GspE/PulE/Tfp pilus assembly ATPase PilB-like protein
MIQVDEGASLYLNVNDLPPEEGVNRVLDFAADLGASDLFFISQETHIRVSVRHLGLLRLLTIMPVELGRRCIAHVKALAGMDVAERRRPLDGRWILRRKDDNAIDLRLNTIPTLYGEDVSVRLLDRESRLLSIDTLGLFRKDYNELLNLLNSPSGLILVTGPTGSGKTTTLYACLAYLNNGERKINTIEDPIEYALDGTCQSQINPRIDLHFAELLRSVLRQAPDVVMVGEVRDPETAEIAVRAANSGLLVLATLHAPVAAGAIQSMLSLGVHPHYLSSSLRGAIAQRLVRTLCPKCRVAYEMPEAAQTFAEVQPYLEPGQGKVLYGPKGCPECRNLGYSGRTGVFEILSVTDTIRRMILAREPTQAIRHKAVEEGMVEFRHAALLKVAQGQTSVEEVFRSVPSEYLSSGD